MAKRRRASDEATEEEIEEGKKRLDKRESETLRHDRWDREDYDHIRAEMEALPDATDALLRITHTARPEMADIFNMFNKAQPELLDPDQIRDDHQINRAVNEQTFDLAEYAELRRFTKGDLVAAAMAAVKVEPELEILFDREKMRQKQADELQKLRDELAQKLQQLMQQMAQQPPPPPQDGEGEDGEGEGEDQQQGQGDGDGDGEGEGQGQGQGGSPSLQDEIDALKRAIEAAERALKDGLSQDAASMAAAMAGAMGDAVDQARHMSTVSKMFGLDPGTLKRLPAKERLEMARKVKESTILSQVAEQFGALLHLAFAHRMRTVDGLPHEVINTTLGDDLVHQLPSEIIRMDDEDLEWQWLADFSEKRLHVFKMQGTERVGKGGIILCEDGSGSMSGQREVMSKAIMLVLLNIAKVEGREFHLIHFGGPGAYKILSFREEKDFTVDAIIEAAELFFGGGTDFVTPLEQAKLILLEEHRRTGRTQSDVVFLTDGYCSLSEEFLEEWDKSMTDIESTTWGICVGPEASTSEPLATLCKGKVYGMDDLQNKGREIKKIFQGV